MSLAVFLQSSTLPIKQKYERADRQSLRANRMGYRDFPKIDGQRTSAAVRKEQRLAVRRDYEKDCLCLLPPAR